MPALHCTTSAAKSRCSANLSLTMTLIEFQCVCTCVSQVERLRFQQLAANPEHIGGRNPAAAEEK